jgi:hypothetical protein
MGGPSASARDGPRDPSSGPVSKGRADKEEVRVVIPEDDDALAELRQEEMPGGARAARAAGVSYRVVGSSQPRGSWRPPCPTSFPGTLIVIVRPSRTTERRALSFWEATISLPCMSG